MRLLPSFQGRRRSSISAATLPCGSSGLPKAQRAEPARTRWASTLRDSPLFGLAPGGGCLAAGITAGAGGLLRRPFTLTTIALRPRGNSFSVALFRQVTPPRALPGAWLFGARTFLGAPLADITPRQRATRSPGQLGHPTRV